MFARRFPLKASYKDRAIPWLPTGHGHLAARRVNWLTPGGSESKCATGVQMVRIKARIARLEKREGFDATGPIPFSVIDRVIERDNLRLGMRTMGSVVRSYYRE